MILPLDDRTEGVWLPSHRADPEVVALADRHYNRQKIGSPQFAPPGRCLVFKLIEDCVVKAFWITSWPFAEYVKHAWVGAWVCSAFRNESSVLSSELVASAVLLTAQTWPVPDIGLITFVHPGKVRRKRDPGRCYLKSRCPFKVVGKTKGGLIAIQATGPDIRAFASQHTHEKPN